MIVLFLTACGSDQVAMESEEFNLETDFQSEYYDWTTEPHPIVEVETTEPHPIVEVENGYYMLVGYYLYYVDKETMEYTPLCNKPNCLHQEETDQMKVLDCNAMFWVPRTMYSTLNYYEGNLYIPTTEMIGKENQLPETKYVMNRVSLDGETREIIHEFEKPVEMAIVHRGYIYYSSSAASLGSESAGIYRISVDGGTEETLYTAESNTSQLVYLQVINNELVFSEYQDENKNLLWKYDLANEEIEQITLGNEENIGRVKATSERIYYAVINEEDWHIESTKLDGSDWKKEKFLSQKEDNDYYYFYNDKNKQIVYDLETQEKITEFSLYTAMDAFYPGRELSFWYSGNDQGGITVSYINREDIPKGDKAVKVLMDFSSDETYPGIVTVTQ